MTRRREVKKRRLRNEIARLVALASKRTDRFTRLNLSAIPAHVGEASEDTWRFDEDDRPIEDGVSPLGFVHLTGRSAWAEREHLREVSLSELQEVAKACRKTYRPRFYRSRIVRVRSDVLLLHCSQYVPVSAVIARIPLKLSVDFGEGVNHTFQTHSPKVA